MRRPALLAALVSSAGLAIFPAPVSAAYTRATCTTTFDIPGADCGTISVPLDRSGAVPGSTKLFFERVPAPTGKSTSTIVVFPGGPGGATSTEGYGFIHDLGKARANHDLLLFDERGTGRSGYLDCDVALTPSYYVPAGEDARRFGKTVERCANKLGARRGFYTTRETVQDLEDVRKALGIDKLVPYGVSYGARDAMAYAQAYPEHVDRVVLDSLVTDAGIEAFGFESLHALPRVLDQMCRGGGCNGISAAPSADLASLVGRLATGPTLRARRQVSVGGCRLRPPITRSRVFALLELIDESPYLLAQLPVALAEAAKGDPYQLSVLEATQSPYLGYCIARRVLKRIGVSPKAFRQDLDLLRKEFSAGNQIARLCEESTLPWPRDTPPSQRQAYAERSLASLPDSSFWPLDRATILAASLVPTCKFWVEQNTTPPSGPIVLPAVPTLVVAGLDDLRTPAEDAEALAMATPTAQLLLVPDVGHSVIESSACARRALGHFMAGEPIGLCHAYPQHRPPPARHVISLQHELDRLLKNLPPGLS